MLTRYVAATMIVALVCLPAHAGGFPPPQGGGGGGGSGGPPNVSAATGTLPVVNGGTSNSAGVGAGGTVLASDGAKYAPVTVAALVSGIGVPTTRQVATSGILAGGGTLASDLTISVAPVSSNLAALAPLNGSSGAPLFRMLSSPDLGGISWAGDTRGTGTAQTVWAIQGRNVAATAPTNAQVLAWNAATSLWTPTTPSGGSGSYPIAPSTGTATSVDANSLAIGSGANVDGGGGTKSLAVGRLAQAGTGANGNAVALGFGAAANGDYSTAMGFLAECDAASSICLGNSSNDQDVNNGSTSRPNTFVVGGNAGGSDGHITACYLGGSGIAQNSPDNVLWTITGAHGTNVAGGSLTIGGSRSTGNAAGGPVYIDTAPAGTTGTSANSSVHRMKVDQLGNVITNASGSNLAQNATDGALYVPRFATGAPSGTPTSVTGNGALGIGGDHHLYAELTSGSWTQIDGGGGNTAMYPWLTAPDLTGHSWLNQGTTATFSSPTAGTKLLSVSAGHTGTEYHAQIIPLPGSGTASIEVGGLGPANEFNTSAGNLVGVIYYDSVNSTAVTWFSSGSALYCWGWTSPTSNFGAPVNGLANGQGTTPKFCRATWLIGGTQLNVYYSNDGLNWVAPSQNPISPNGFGGGFTFVPTHFGVVWGGDQDPSVSTNHTLVHYKHN